MALGLKFAVQRAHVNPDRTQEDDALEIFVVNSSQQQSNNNDNSMIRGFHIATLDIGKRVGSLTTAWHGDVHFTIGTAKLVKLY